MMIFVKRIAQEGLGKGGVSGVVARFVSGKVERNCEGGKLKKLSPYQ